MPSGNLEIVHDFSAVTNKVIITIAENSNPAAEVAPRVVLNAPHTAGDVTIFENLRLVLHRIKCYESSDGVTLETLLHSWTVQAKKTKPVVRRYFYRVDGGRTNVTDNTGTEVWSDPVSTETQVVDERLSDAIQIIILSEGGGLRQEGINYQLLNGGGWVLLNGEQFSQDEKWTVIAIWDVDVVEGGSTTSSDTDIHEVDADGDFDNTYYSKENIAGGSADVLTTTFPDFALIPSKTKAKFSTYTGSQKVWVLQFANGNTVRYQDEDRNQIRLGKDELIELFWKTDDTGTVKCYVKEERTGYEKVGQRVLVDRWDFTNGKNGNKILLDGTQYSINGIIQRLYDEHISKLAKTVTFAEWNSDPNNQHYYAVDLVGGNVIVPKDLNMHYRALKTFDGNNGDTGLYTPDKLQDHRHSQSIGTIPSTIWGRLLTTLIGAGLQIGRYNGLMGNTQGGTDLTSSPCETDGSDYLPVSDETTVKAVRQYAAVYI